MDPSQMNIANPDSDIASNVGMLGQVLSYPITAFTLVVAFAWNSAFQSWFKHHPRFNKHGPWVYAVSVTALCIVFIIGLYYIQKKASSATDFVKNSYNNKHNKNKSNNKGNHKSNNKSNGNNNKPQIPKETFMLL
jgi:hypothetical protein